jgi:hypothetical protein
MQPKPMSFQSFACEAEPLPANTPAASRRSERSTSFDLAAPYHPPSVQFFDCETVELPDGALAAPRPKGKERRVPVPEASSAFPDVEQKVVSVLLSSRANCGKPSAEHFGTYLAEGWRVKQLTSLPAGESDGWLIVLLERVPNAALQMP